MLFRKNGKYIQIPVPNETKKTDDGWNELALSIILQAVEDWRELIARKREHISSQDGPPFSFNELRVFFKSNWCRLLTSPTSINPEIILHKLESELEKQ